MSEHIEMANVDDVEVEVLLAGEELGEDEIQAEAALVFSTRDQTLFAIEGGFADLIELVAGAQVELAHKLARARPVP